MRRYVPILVAGSALIAAACRDTVAPARSENQPTTLAFVGNQSYSALAAELDPNQKTVAFRLSPDGGVATFGAFTLTYDPNAVCDPATSGYGPTTWKNACRSLETGMDMTATFGRDSDGNDYVEFAPDIRFNPEKQVTLSTIRPQIVGESFSLAMYLEYNIWYFQRVGTTNWFIDEAWFDRELVTRFDTTTGVVRRKIRHFSGWLTGSGYCQENPSAPECQEGP